MTRLILKKGRVIDPAQQLDAVQDIYIANGKIVSNSHDFTADKIIDCSNKIVCPGLIDVGTRFSARNQESDATLASESSAAIANGFTTLICQPDSSNHLIDNGITAEAVLNRAKKSAKAKIMLLGALTEKLKGEQLAPMATLKSAGCVGLSQGYGPIKDTRLWRHCFEYAANFDLPLCIHPQDYWLAEDGVMHEGEVSMRLGLPGIPALSETIALSQALLLQQQTGAKLHFSCITAAASVALLAQAREQGIAVTADVALSHLYLTEWDVDGFNVECHTLPPLRGISDQEALLRGIENGLITSLCSNHMPLGGMAKLAPFPSTTPGISALDGFIPLLAGLATKTNLSLLEIIRLATEAPANLFNLSSGTLRTDAAADICVFDDTISFTLSAENMHSKGKNSPFVGWPLQGQVVYTLVNGEVVYG